MPTRLFQTYKFRYTQDDNTTLIRIQRVYEDTTGGPSLTPITSKFLARTLPDRSKIEPILGKLRRLDAFITNPNVQRGYSEVQAYMPYHPSDSDLNEHIREVLAVNNVDCARYRGETRQYA